MKEFEIYLPKKRRDGQLIPDAQLEAIKEELRNVFGGYTAIGGCEGTWKSDDHESHEEITILRILDDGSAAFAMKDFRERLERELDQERLLITERTITVI